MAYFLVWQIEFAEGKSAFERAAEARTSAVERRIESELDLIRAVRAFYTGSTRVERHEFRAFVSGFLGDRRSSVQAIEWIPRVPAAQRELLERQARADGLVDFRFTERSPAGDLVTAAARDEYFPVYFVEPLAGNEPALGFDLGSNPARRTAMELSRASGALTATESIRLVQEQSEQAGILVFGPVYRDAELPAAERLQGFALAVIHVGRLIEGTFHTDHGLAQAAGIDLYTYDRDAPPANQMLYLHASRARENDSAPSLSLGQSLTGPHTAHDLKVGGRRWTLVARPIDSTFSSVAAWQPWVAMIAGLTMTGLLLAILVGHLRRTETAEQRLRAVTDTIVDGVINIDTRGRVWSFNPAAERIFGYKESEVIGRNVKILMPEPYRGEHDGYLRAYQETGHAKVIGIGREVEGRRKDGSVFPLDLAVSEVAHQGRRLFTGLVRDISERKGAEQALLNYSDRLTLATRASGIGVWDYDLVGGALEWDDSMLHIYHVSRERFAGAYEFWRQSLHPDDLPRAEAELNDAIAGGKAFDTEFRIRWPDGQERDISASALVIRDKQGQAQRMIGVNLDITERKQIERMKTEFISTVSHELRTPLTSIMGSLGLMREGVTGELPDATRRMIDIAYNNSGRLVRLINDILDVEKIESGKMEFQIQPLDLTALVRDSLETNEGYAREHQVPLVLTGDPPSVQVSGDADRLTQVLTNLLSNAVKFSPQGGRVEVSLEQDDPQVRVSVMDQGPGIPEEFRDRIFQRFSQADAASTRRKGGSGLGLSICRGIVKRHGGRIGFKDRPGGGSCFFFELQTLSDRPERHSSTDEQVATRGRVLVCEDDADVAGLIRMILERDGYAADVALSAAEAKRMLAANSGYRAMTLDLVLPDQDGVDLIRELRNDPATRELPIIVVSIKAELGKQELSGDAFSIVDWMTKPIDPQRLLEGVLHTPPPTETDLPRILHVEDDPDVAQVVREVLLEQGEVFVAPNLAEARRLLRSKNFQLIILDLTLPDGSGEELLAELHQSDRPTPQVIVFSASEVPANLGEQIRASLLKSRASNQDLIDMVNQVIRDPDNETASTGDTP